MAWLPTSDDPGRVVIAKDALFWLVGVLNCDASQEPIALASNWPTVDGSDLVAVNSSPVILLNKTGVDIKNRVQFSGTSLTGQRMAWIPYEFVEYFPQPTSDLAWPQYWCLAPLVGTPWKLKPIVQGLQLDGTSGVYFRLGRADKAREKICVVEIPGTVIVDDQG